MMNSLVVKSCAVVLIALFIHTPSAFATCSRLQSPGPPVSMALVYNYTFDEDCDKWVALANAYIVGGYPGNAYFPSYGQIYQYVDVPHDFQAYSLSFEVQVNGSVPGPEQLHILINGNVVGMIGAWHADGRYDIPLDDLYGDQTIVITVERPWVSNPGDTEFVVEWLQMWGTF